MIKLVAFDMDGTFLRSDNTYDRERFARIYAVLKVRGIRMAVISGNQYAQLASFFPEVADELLIISENGGLIFEGGQLLWSQAMEEADVTAILKVLQAEGLDREAVLCGIRSAYLLASARQEFKDNISIYYHVLEEVADFLPLPADDFVKLALLVPEGRTQEFMALLQAASSQRLTPVSSGHGSIDIIQTGIHKGAALRWLGQRLGIAPEEMMTFGDGGNDLEMLAYVGESYAMANGSEAVKATAKYQAPSNQEDGVLQVLEEELLG